MGFRPIHLDGAIQFLDPATGLRVDVEAPQTRAYRQRAPRSVQFAITNHCNLACAFCSRPASRPSTWTVESALALLADLDRLGVAEVAFGGGEPLVFRGFFELVDRLHVETTIAVHLTTNGTLLDDAAIARLRGRVGEIRVSVYDDEDWRGTVGRLVAHRMRFGVNLLVTPASLPELSARLDELEALGCRDVLLLPVLGVPALRLDPATASDLRPCWNPAAPGRR